ncbi:hypothetical protein CHS0354_030853, partial [Potamilus streckersoni]
MRPQLFNIACISTVAGRNRLYVSSRFSTTNNGTTPPPILFTSKTTYPWASVLSAFE